ncbi:hypothetical protein CO051_02320 [Candidatus Roizmanbacteria bacterium CG_4_9_14_0_2_um_filter_39_13]|uniref:DUF3467 domain-containing protein n=1 Tax=Candidatus Roizmanbacteria bacterium CG_4_9_14_0_2_um_filter_39_13 TaxID=1974839 RepID=A0A2M8F0S6_9BACT|nr:MAG: hypothetical protein CO051_02320 [Candidatus Roizmanbacteria bacterium CG_4_9_14_0_2_um_filter_39_13]
MQNKQNNIENYEVNLNLDSTPILYSDNVMMHINDFGVVLDIGQNLGDSKKVRLVSRIGMSREHAEKLVQELGKLLAMTKGQKQTGEKR